MYGPEVVGDVSRANRCDGALPGRRLKSGSGATRTSPGRRSSAAIVARRDGIEEAVPYWTTGVFGHDETGWGWRYWGGAEPQAEPNV